MKKTYQKQISELAELLASLDYDTLGMLNEQLFTLSREKAEYLAHDTDVRCKDAFYMDWVDDPTTSVNDVQTMLGLR
jgi:hypothetical protein